jgi:nucleotide-binding universal stress UspA family protein
MPAPSLTSDLSRVVSETAAVHQEYGMNQAFSSASIIVGIDGSKAAIRAAVWAIDEAVRRDVPLRLVHVITEDPDATLHSRDLDLDYARAEHAIHQATMAVEAVGAPVRLQMEILRGQTTSKLIDEALSAAMLCVGQTGHLRRKLGSIASALLRSSGCPVAVIRLHEGASLDGRWVIAIVDDSINAQAVLRHAVDEAQLRTAPLLVLTTTAPAREIRPGDENIELAIRRRLTELSGEVGRGSMCSLPVGDAVLDYLAANSQLAQLVVISADDASLTTALTDRHRHAVLGHTNCSVMSVRKEQPHPEQGVDMTPRTALLTTNDYVREAEARWVADGGALAEDRRWTLSAAGIAPTMGL